MLYIFYHQNVQQNTTITKLYAKIIFRMSKIHSWSGFVAWLDRSKASHLEQIKPPKNEKEISHFYPLGNNPQLIFGAKIQICKMDINFAWLMNDDMNLFHFMLDATSKHSKVIKK